MKARDLVLVLVGHHPVQLARHDAAQRLVGAARGERLDIGAVAGGIGGVLIIGQPGAAVGQDVGECLGRPAGCRRRDAGAHDVRIAPHQPAEIEGKAVFPDLDPVQRDRLSDGVGRDRDMPGLPGGAEHHHVGIDRVTQQRLGDGIGVESLDGVTAAGACYGGQPVIHLQVQIAVADNLAGGHLGEVENGGRALSIGLHRRRRGRYHGIASDQRIRRCGSDPCLVQHAGAVRQPDKAHHGAEFLRQAGEIQQGCRGAVEMRRHRQHRPDCGDTGAADAGHQDVIGRVSLRQGRGGQCRHCRFDIGKPAFICRGGAARPLDRHEAGAESVEAGEILVAAGQVDPALAPQRRVHRLDAQAIRCHRTVAASLADLFVDDDITVRVLHLPALAAAAFFRGACLAVDQDRNARMIAQLALQRVHLRPVVETGQRREIAARDTVQIISDEGDPLHAFRVAAVRDTCRRQLAVHRLAAGHRNRVIVQDLEGDVGFGSHRLADGERAGMEPGAVADILEDVPVAVEPAGADPAAAFAAHLADIFGIPVHQRDQEMAADPG